MEMNEERMVLVDFHLSFSSFVLCVMIFPFPNIVLSDAHSFCVPHFHFLFHFWCLGILLPSSWSASDARRQLEDILMPELWALGVERKGESTCENAGGLDFW